MKEAIESGNIENIISMFNDELMAYTSSQDIVADEELEKQKFRVKKASSEQQSGSRREASSGRKQLVSNYSRNKMFHGSKKRNADEKIKKEAGSGVDLAASDSSVYLNATETIKSSPTIALPSETDTMESSKDVKQNNCRNYLKLLDDLCEKIMEESENITLMQVNELLVQLKWKLLNYSGKAKRSPVVLDANLPSKDSLVNVNCSSHCDVPVDESTSQLEPVNCTNKLSVSLELPVTDKNNTSKRSKIQKSRFPNKDTVKFAGVLKLDTSTWNNKSKNKASLNIGTSKEIKFSNLDVGNNKKVNDKRKVLRNEKLSILRSSKSKTDVKGSEQSVLKKPKISDEKRLDDRSVEKGLSENRSVNKERKRNLEPYKHEAPSGVRDHKELISQIKRSFKDYVESAKDRDTKKSVKQIKTKKLSDFQSKSVVKKPLDVNKSKAENTAPIYVNCPESKINILDADGSSALFDDILFSESNLKALIDVRKDGHRDSSSVPKFKEEIIDVDEDKKLRSRSKNFHDSKGSLLKLAQSQSKVRMLKNSSFSCTDSLTTPVESLMTSVDLNQGPIKATNSQLLRISLLKAGTKMSNVSVESDVSTTSFKDMKVFDEFIG